MIIQRAREQVASVVNAKPDGVIFTSGAIESDNLALLGLVAHAENERQHHIISTSIEYKAVLKPLHELGARGFEVSFVHPHASGKVSVEAVANVLRPDAVLVSIRLKYHFVWTEH